jgi:hypothetical protein
MTDGTRDVAIEKLDWPNCGGESRGFEHTAARWMPGSLHSSASGDSGCSSTGSPRSSAQRAERSTSRPPRSIVFGPSSRRRRVGMRRLVLGRDRRDGDRSTSRTAITTRTTRSRTRGCPSGCSKGLRPSPRDSEATRPPDERPQVAQSSPSVRRDRYLGVGRLRRRGARKHVHRDDHAQNASLGARGEPRRGPSRGPDAAR